MGRYVDLMATEEPLSEQGRAVAVRQYASMRRIGMLLAIGGLLMASVGGVLLYRAWDFDRHAIAVEVTAVDVERHIDEDQDSFSATFVFEDEAGEVQRVRPWYSSSEFPSREGQRVDIRYDVRDPARIAMEGWFGTWGLPVILSGAGLVLVVFGAALLLARMPGRLEQAAVLPG
ncbi:MAG: DUF3592 domain-containing protein [Planctomycetota bacterium]